MLDLTPALFERSETVREMALKSKLLYEDLRHHLEILPAWTDENLHQVVEDIAKEFELKLGKVAQPIRVAVTGSTVSPPINTTLRLLGKKPSLERIDRVTCYLTK